MYFYLWLLYFYLFQNKKLNQEFIAGEDIQAGDAVCFIIGPRNGNLNDTGFSNAELKAYTEKTLGTITAYAGYKTTLLGFSASFRKGAVESWDMKMRILVKDNGTQIFDTGAIGMQSYRNNWGSRNEQYFAVNKVLTAGKTTTLIGKGAGMDSRVTIGGGIYSAYYYLSVEGEGKVYKANISNTRRRCFIGFATNSATTGEAVNVLIYGIHSGDFVAGTKYYLGTTNGALATSGAYMVGKGISDNHLMFDKQNYATYTYTDSRSGAGSSVTQRVRPHSFGYMPQTWTGERVVSIDANKIIYRVYDGSTSSSSYNAGVNVFMETRET